MLEELQQQELQEDLVVPRLEVAPPAPVLLENDQRQRRRMVIALVMLLVALGMVLIKDRDFWFPSSDVADSEVVDDSMPAPTTENATADSTPAAAVPRAPVVRKRARSTPPPAKRDATPAASSAAGVTSTRAVLPPLSVVVVAGGQSQVVKPAASPSVKVELKNGTAPQPVSDVSRAAAELAAAAKVPASPAGDRVEMSTDTRQALTRPVRPEYPLLARQMKVQGAVVLNVFIDKDGAIQNVSVLSGPAILADAAREAVKQWRFKPYYQDGQPVETQARVTVDFTIRTQ
jgi:protein TonB